MTALALAFLENRGTMPRMLLMAARLALFGGFATTAIPVAALASMASPREMECHAEATKRYIEDIRRVGRTREESSVTTVAYVNDKSNYETYYIECLGRWNSTKPDMPPSGR